MAFGKDRKVFLAEFDADGSAYTRKLNDAQMKTKRATEKIQANWKKIGAAMVTYFGAREILTYAEDAVNLARQLEGVKRAFDKLNNPNLLKRLREATNGTVSDLLLMQTAVRADNFKIPLELLTRGLEFAQKRALATGENIDYMVESFITGVARKSIPILDNLGISQLNLNKEIKKTGNFYEAIGNIVDEELGKMGDDVDTAKEKADQLNATLENLQAAVGRDLVKNLDEAQDGLNDVADAMLRIDNVLYGKSGKGLVGNIIDAAEAWRQYLSPLTAVYGVHKALYNTIFGEEDVSMQNPRFWMGGGTTTPGNIPTTGPTTTTKGGKKKITGKNAMDLEALNSQTGSGQISASGFLPGFDNLSMSGVEQPLFKPFPDDWQSQAASVRDYTLSMAAEFGYAMQSAFGGAGDTLISKLSTALQIAVNIARSVSNFGSEGGGGLGGILGIVASIIPGFGLLSSLGGGASAAFSAGGSVINYGGGNVSVSGIPHFATGGSMVVPPGFSGDNFPFMAKSGERIDITPMNRIPVAEKLLGEIKSSIQAMNANNIMGGSGKQSVSVNIDGKQLAEIVQARTNDLSKSKTALEQL